MKLIHDELTFNLVYDDYQATDRKIREEVQEEVHKQYQNQLKKLQQLRLNKPGNRNPTDKPNSENSFKFYNRVVNLSEVFFNKSELDFLEKGLKYCPNTNNAKDIELLATKTELILDFAQKSLQDKYITAQKLNSNNMLTHNNRESRMLKQVKTKIDANDLTISKADKGNTLTIMTRTHYQSKMEEMINSDEFVKLKSDPTNAFHRSINKEINNYTNIFPNNNPQNLKIMNPVAPVLYGMPKLHKEGIPMRPVVSYINAPSYKLCKQLCSDLPNIINCTSPYSVKNSLELIEKLKNKDVPDNYKLVSFDVKSLFTSIPTGDVKTIVTSLINNSELIDSNKTALIKVIETCLEQNYFKFNNQIYKQTNGLPMGSPLSPLLSELYMTDFETNVFSNKNFESINKHVHFWARYVDDIFCIWTGTDRQLSQFLNILNNINDSIQFTLEMEIENSLNFLDLKFFKNNNKLEVDIFRKPTTTDTVIHAKSNQSWQIKMSAFHSLIHRLLNVPLNKVNYLKELNIIKTIAQNNGYNAKLIDKLVKNKKHKNILKEFYSHNSDNNKNDKKWFSVNYVSGISNKISNSLNKLDINCIAVNKNNLAKYLVNNKEKGNINTKSGIYQINCNDCDAIYIGQTGRCLQTRIKEHRHQILHNQRKTGFAEHCIDHNHYFTNDRVKLLNNIQKGRHMNYLEIYAIKKSIASNKNITNTQVDFGTTPIIDAAIKLGT